MGPQTLATSNRHGNIITVKIVKHSEDEEGEPEEAATQQEPSGGTADQSNDTETSEEENQLEELELPKFDPGTTNVDPDKKVNKKGRGTIPRAVKKPVPKPSSAPTSNHSTPKKARKGPRTQTHNTNPNTLQDDLLKEFVNEAKDLSKKVDRTVTEWKDGNNDGVHLGKKTSANLELLREALIDKINDVNETWADMAEKLCRQQYYAKCVIKSGPRRW